VSKKYQPATNPNPISIINPIHKGKISAPKSRKPLMFPDLFVTIFDFYVK
jgi:hypothetical protein